MQTAEERVLRTRQRLEEERMRGRMSNKDYFAMLRAQYGEKAEKVGHLHSRVLPPQN